MEGRLLLASGISCLAIAYAHSSALAQSVLTWQSLQASIQQGGVSSLRELTPPQLPPEFAGGQFAITALHTGRTAYVVTKIGKRLSNVSTVIRQQSGRNISFNAASGYPELANMPALNSFPTQLYNVGELVEVSRYAARYDGEGTRSRVRQSQKKTLSDGRNAYYLRQDNGRQGWCTFESESVKFSRFICVNIAGSSNSALTLLESIFVKSRTPQIATNRSPSTPQAYKESGDRRSNNGDKKGAIADYTAAIRLNPNFAIAYYNRAVDRVAIGEKQGAIADFKKAAELFGNQGKRSDRQDALNEIAKLEGKRTPQEKLALQTFKDAKALGMAQLLPDKLSFLKMIQNGARGQYSISVIPKAEFLDKKIVDRIGSGCLPFVNCPDEKKISYSDYLKLKLQVKAQDQIWTQQIKVIAAAISDYHSKLSADSRGGGQQTAKKLDSLLNDADKTISTKMQQRQSQVLSLGNIGTLLKDGFFQGVKLAAAGAKFDFDLAPAAIRVFLRSKGLNVSQPGTIARTNFRSRLAKLAIHLEYTAKVTEILPKSFKAFLNGKDGELRNAVMAMAAETAGLIEYERLSGATGISPHLKEVVETYQRIQEIEKIRLDLDRVGILDARDKSYLDWSIRPEQWRLISAVASSVEDIGRVAGLSQQRWFAEVDNAHKIADSIQSAFFNASDSVAQQNLRNDFQVLLRNYEQQQIIISAYSTFLDAVAEEIGQYSLKSRSDVVTKRSDGTIAVSINGVVNPRR